MTTLFYILLLSTDQTTFVPFYLVIAILVDIIVGAPKFRSLINVLIAKNSDDSSLNPSKQWWMR